MVVSPRSSHSFRIPAVWHDVGVVGEFLVVDGALPVLLGNLAVQEVPHLSR